MDELEEIIENKDRSKITKILMSRKESLYQLARPILRDERYIDDVVQETMITAFFGFDKLNKAKSFDSWLKKMLINEALKTLRKLRREILVGDEFLSNICQVDTNFLSVEQKMDFKTRINSLSNKNKIALILHFEIGYTQKEVAEILGRTESTIKSRIDRSLDKLKEFEEKGGDEKWENEEVTMK